MWRTILLSLGVLLALTVTPAAADPVNNPRVQTTFTVTCIVDGQSTTFQLIGTAMAGHVLEDNSIGVIMSGTLTTFVNGVQTEQITFPAVPGEGLRTVPCTATAEFEDEEGNLVSIEITDAQVLLTPP